MRPDTDNRVKSASKGVAVDWDTVQTVLLDMDGTLLDLNFDNYFWRHHVPQRYAEKHDLELDDARDILFGKYQAVEGTIEWYCVDYWTDTLKLDIAELKQEVDHLIAVHPDVIAFLTRLQALGRPAVLVTNAHHKALTLKMDRTGLHEHLDLIICSHEFGIPKEQVEFWERLRERVPFEPRSTLLVDDSLPVLRSAQRYGIAHLRAVYTPDSQHPPKDVGEFAAIHSFAEIMP